MSLITDKNDLLIERIAALLVGVFVADRLKQLEDG